MANNSRYVRLYNEFSVQTARLSDEELGRLVRGMISYNQTGEEPELDGNESFVWPFVQTQIDKDNAEYDAYLAKQQANGAKGGRPRKDASACKKPMGFSENPPKPNKSNNNNNSEVETGSPYVEPLEEKKELDIDDNWQVSAPARKGTAGVIVKKIREENLPAAKDDDLYGDIVMALENGVEPVMVLELARNTSSAGRFTAALWGVIHEKEFGWSWPGGRS